MGWPEGGGRRERVGGGWAGDIKTGGNVSQMQTPCTLRWEILSNEPAVGGRSPGRSAGGRRQATGRPPAGHGPGGRHLGGGTGIGGDGDGGSGCVDGSGGRGPPNTCNWTNENRNESLFIMNVMNHSIERERSGWLTSSSFSSSLPPPPPPALADKEEGTSHVTWWLLDWSMLIGWTLAIRCWSDRRLFPSFRFIRSWLRVHFVVVLSWFLFFFLFSSLIYIWIYIYIAIAPPYSPRSNSRAIPEQFQFQSSFRAM